MNDHIKRFLGSGISIIPVGPDKRPLVEWKRYQESIAAVEAESWALPIAAVCGKVSGGLLCIDFDDKGSAFKEWCDRVKQVRPDLPDKLYVQRTPSGGWHVVMRTSLQIGNKKIASRLPKEGETEKAICLVETRGNGGYFLLAPSEGYYAKKGDITTLQPISAGDAETLLLIAESLNEVSQEFNTPKHIAVPFVKNGVTPFDDYDAKKDPVDLLCANGWSIVAKKSDKVILCRPGKKQSVSATWNHISGRFYVFSTSTDFESQHVYKPSAVYAFLEHRGDFVAAAKELYKQGFGSRLEEKKLVDYDTAPRTETIRASDFRERIYQFYKGQRERGLRLGLANFDKLLRFDRGYLNVVTGISTHGKSEFLDFIMVKLATLHQWRFVVFSPENFPLEIHFNKLAEKWAKQSMWDAEQLKIDQAIDFCDFHFEFVNATEEELTLETILATCLDVKQKRPTHALVIDPWNEIEQAMRPKDVSETEFTGICLRKLRKFARKNNLCIFIVVHPTKMYREKGSQVYPVPTLYDVSGSAHWYNKADNGLVIYRNFETKKESTDVYVKKVKFRNYGELGMVKFHFDKGSSNYEEFTEQEMAQDAFCG
jgi:hypothetical protein